MINKLMSRFTILTGLVALLGIVNQVRAPGHYVWQDAESR